jgi:hypothetical protein
VRDEARGKDKAFFRKELKGYVDSLAEIINDIIVGLKKRYNWLFLELCYLSNKTIATAESCTGGHSFLVVLGCWIFGLF